MKINQLPFAYLEIKLKVGKMFVCHFLIFFGLKKIKINCFWSYLKNCKFVEHLLCT